MFFINDCSLYLLCNGRITFFIVSWISSVLSKGADKSLSDLLNKFSSVMLYLVLFNLLEEMPNLFKKSMSFLSVITVLSNF